MGQLPGQVVIATETISMKMGGGVLMIQHPDLPNLFSTYLSTYRPQLFLMFALFQFRPYVELRSSACVCRCSGADRGTCSRSWTLLSKQY